MPEVKEWCGPSSSQVTSILCVPNTSKYLKRRDEVLRNKCLRIKYRHERKNIFVGTSYFCTTKFNKTCWNFGHAVGRL